MINLRGFYSSATLLNGCGNLMWNIRLCNNFVQIVHKEGGNSNESKMFFTIFLYYLYLLFIMLIVFYYRFVLLKHFAQNRHSEYSS